MWCVATGLRALYTGAEVCGCSVPGSGSGSDQYQVVSVFSGCRDRRHKTYNVTIHYQQTPDARANGLTNPSQRLSYLYFFSSALLKLQLLCCGLGPIANLSFCCQACSTWKMELHYLQISLQSHSIEFIY